MFFVRERDNGDRRQLPPEKPMERMKEDERMERESGMDITFFGTTTLLFDDGIDQVLFDGHFTRPSLLRLAVGTLETDTGVADRLMQTYPMERLRAVFVSHSHHDHVMDVPYIANTTGAEVYGSASTRNVALGGGVPEEKIHLFEPFRPVAVGTFRITVIPSVHSEAKWYNDDLGQTIDEPLVQPARKRAYKEGGSVDFLIRHGERQYLIRPSFNFLEGQLDSVRADVLFLGIGGMGNAPEETLRRFYSETIDKVLPEKVIPVHWDNFFAPLRAPLPYQMRFVDDIAGDMEYLKARLDADGVAFDVVDAFETVTL